MQSNTIQVGGTVFTTAAEAGPDSVTIVTRSDVPSVVLPLGPVELHQPQAVRPRQLQSRAPVPACGMISIDEGVLAGLDGTSTLRYRCAEVPFATDEELVEQSGLHPIVFSGALTVLGGTGELAGATGTLEFSGRYSFTDNAGYFALAGSIDVPAVALS